MLRNNNDQLEHVFSAELLFKNEDEVAFFFFTNKKTKLAPIILKLKKILETVLMKEGS